MQKCKKSSSRISYFLPFTFQFSVFTFNPNNLQHSFIGDLEPYIISGKRHAIHPVRVIVILRTWIKFQYLAKSSKILIAE